MFNVIINERVLNINGNEDSLFMRRMNTGNDDIHAINILLIELQGDNQYMMEIQRAYGLNDIPISIACNLVHDEREETLVRDHSLLSSMINK